MANIEGPTQSKRGLLMSTTQAVLLYGAEIWADSLDKEYKKRTQVKIQRTAALRRSSAYKIVDHEKNGEEINYQTIRESTLQQWQI